MLRVLAGDMPAQVMHARETGAGIAKKSSPSMHTHTFRGFPF